MDSLSVFRPIFHGLLSVSGRKFIFWSKVLTVFLDNVKLSFSEEATPLDLGPPIADVWEGVFEAMTEITH